LNSRGYLVLSIICETGFKAGQAGVSS